jgi:type IV secretion system protein VirD4
VGPTVRSSRGAGRLLSDAGGDFDGGTVSDRPVSTGTDIWLSVAVAVLGLGAVLWAAGAASAWLSGHPIRSGVPAAGLGALAHLGDPSAAWGGPVGPPVLYWSLAAAGLVLAGSVVFAGWRLWHSTSTSSRGTDPSRAAGVATRVEVRKAAGGRRLVAQAVTLRPSLGRARPCDVGYQLGAARGIGAWASVEDSMLILGPPRSGKGMNLVIPMVLDAPGAVVTTSTRPDNLSVTLTARAARGPVMVFDPQDLAGGSGPAPLAWSLMRGCDLPRVAMIRAEALVADAGRSGVENASFWRNQAVSATRCLLHAAALDHRPTADLYRWSHSAGSAKEAVTVLATHPDATPGWDRALDAIVSGDERVRDSTWAMVANAFAPLADPAVLAALTPEPGGELDPTAFLALRGTVYLLGTSSGASATATIVAALLEDLVDAARRLAARSPGQRLDPPVALILDDAANYPLASLPSLMSEGGGSGITTVAVLQSLADARDRWGTEAAGAIWDSAIVKVILGGSANASDLADISRLIGEREVVEVSETVTGGAGGRSMSSVPRWRPILEPSELRRLGLGVGLLLLRAAPPIMLRLHPWTARSDASGLRAARRQWELATINAAQGGARQHHGAIGGRVPSDA